MITNEIAIEVKDLWKRFIIPHEKRSTVFEAITEVFRKTGREEFWALRDINFSVKKGEFVGIIGENGCGKTTLLNLIANILRATKGKIRVSGNITSFLELGIGFQPDLTARENIYLDGAIRGLSDKEVDDRLDDIFEFSGLRKFEDTKLKNFSSGMYVRLAFATAIQANPDILLVDEILAAGDMEFQQKCFDTFRDYINEGKTILFVSHDLNMVRRFCEKTLYLRKGEQVAFGETDGVIDSYVHGVGKGRIGPAKGWKKGKAYQEKDLVITDVELLDKRGDKRWVFRAGDPLTVRIWYEAKRKINDPVFGIGIYSENEVFCYGTNTEMKNQAIESMEGNGHLDLYVKRLTMLEGNFLLSVDIRSRDHILYHRLVKQFTFHVIKKTFDVGLFEVPCSWVLDKHEKKL